MNRTSTREEESGEKVSVLDAGRILAAARAAWQRGDDAATMRLLGPLLGGRQQAKEPSGGELALLRRVSPGDSDDEADDALHYGEDLLARFMSLFQGRPDVHAIQYHHHGAPPGYRPVRREATRLDWIAHLDGDLTLGTYPVQPDGTVRFGALDVDVRKDFIAQWRLDSSFAARADRQMRDLVRLLLTRCRERSLPASLEWSGYKGYHLWFFFDRPVPAAAVRALLGTLAEDTGPHPFCGVEVFPKQDTLREGGLGNLIKVPLGTHRVSGRRSCFLDPESFSPLEPSRALKCVRFVPVERLPSEALFRNARPAAPGTLVHDRAIPAPGPGSPRPQPGAREPLSTPSRRESPYRSTLRAAVPSATAADVAAVIRGCPVLEEVVKRAFRNHHLRHAERVSLLYTVGHMGKPGHETLHRVISRCSDYEPWITESHYRSLQPNPMGCRGLRRWVPGLYDTHCAGCRFDPAPGWYPSPVLHAPATAKTPAPPRGPRRRWRGGDRAGNESRVSAALEG